MICAGAGCGAQGSFSCSDVDGADSQLRTRVREHPPQKEGLERKPLKRTLKKCGKDAEV